MPLPFRDRPARASAPAPRPPLRAARVLATALVLGAAAPLLFSPPVAAQTDHSGHGAAAAAATATTKAPAPRRVLYYRNPMGLPDISPVPKKDTMGMDYVPVYADDAPAPMSAPALAPTAGSAEAKPAAARKILYYRNPMGLPDTSPAPKKDPMGMDYVPVYADEAAAASSGAVTVSADKVQKLGVRTEAVTRRAIGRAVRAVGAVAVDERREVVVAPKVTGWIEVLKADTTGVTVKRGDVLMEVYSPELTAAEQELVAARKTRADLADATLYRLRNLDVPEDEIDRLIKTGQALRTMPYRAPADGVILEKTAVRGMRFSAGDTLFRIADLSHVWVIAEVFEQDLGSIKPGQTARVSVNALPGRAFAGTVSFVYPTVTADSRTVKVRVEMDNPDGVLKPNLYATVDIDTAETVAVAVPDSAVLDTGKRRVVLVEAGDGRYVPRAVRTGQRGGGWIAVEDGLAEGERVVVRANFLIDSESNLKAALAAFAPPETSAAPEATP